MMRIDGRSVAEIFATISTKEAAAIRGVDKVQIFRLVAEGLHPPPLQDRPGGVTRHIKSEQFEMLQFLAGGIRTRQELIAFVADIVRRRVDCIAKARKAVAA